MFRVMLVPSDMVLIYVCLVFLQLAACSSRTADGYEPKELSKGQISKFIIPLLDSSARKNDIKVQVVPYYNYKSKKRDRTGKISPSGKSKDNNKDVPVTVILADPKYMKRVSKISSEESDEHVTHKTLGAEPKRQFTEAPLWERLEDKFSEKDSLSDNFLTIEVNKNDAKVSNKAIEEVSSESYSDDSFSSESTENEYEDLKNELKTVNLIDIAKSIKDSESSESDVKLFNNFHHAPIEKHKQNDNIIKSSKKHGNVESNKNILHPYEDHEHLIKYNHSILRSIISESENTSNQKQNSLKSEKELESSEEINLKPQKNHTYSGINRQSHNKIIILNDFEDIDKRSDSIIRSAKSLEDSKSTENNRKSLENHERSHINEQSHNNINNISTHLDYFDHEPIEIHRYSDSLIKSAKSLESLEENEDGISISELIHNVSLSHINLNDSDHDPVNIHKPNDNIIRQTKSSEDLESPEVINPGQNSSQLNKLNNNDVIPLNSGQVQNFYDNVIKNSKSLEDSANSDISELDSLQVSQHHQEGHDSDSSVYIRNSNESIQYHEDASESASEYYLSESSSKDDNVEKSINNLEEETEEEFVTDIPLTDSYEEFETVKYKVDDLTHPQLSLNVDSGISELEGQPIAFVKGAKLQKLEIKDKSDDIFLPVKHDYPRLASVERSDIKDSSLIKEIDYHSLWRKKNSRATDNKSSDENSKERSGKPEKNERTLVAPDGVINEDEYAGNKILEAIKSYIKRAHELNSKSYNLSFLFNK